MRHERKLNLRSLPEITTAPPELTAAPAELTAAPAAREETAA